VISSINGAARVFPAGVPLSFGPLNNQMIYAPLPSISLSTPPARFNSPSSGKVPSPEKPRPL
ncbi:hypothetical protein CEXT_784751, partial [Caerostris extrusa]